jgi:uncharacterized membrane protein HdeD (DUF308 family)
MDMGVDQSRKHHEVAEVLGSDPIPYRDHDTILVFNGGRAYPVFQNDTCGAKRRHGTANLPAIDFVRLRSMTTEYAPDRVLNYAFLLGGITTLIFGAILVFRQDAAIGIVALLIGLWWLIQGAFLVFSVFIDSTDAWWKLLLGIIGVTAGIVVLSNPVQSGTLLGSALAIFLGVMGLLAGVVGVIGGFRGGGLPAILFGVVSAAVGLLLMFYPEGSFSTAVTIVGIILMVNGVVSMFLAFAAR